MTTIETLAVYTAIVVVVALLLGFGLAKLGDRLGWKHDDRFPWEDLD